MTGDKQPVRTYHEGKPVSDYATKKALLVAAPKDKLQIEGHGEMEVVERDEPYFGLEITLHNGETNYRLIPHGFAHDPELWRADLNERGYIEGWELVGHVSAEVSEVGDTMRCPKCGDTLKNMRERQSALVAGVCPHE